MAEKRYEVIAEKYTGKHKVYAKGAIIPESEVFGSLDLALNGQKDKKRGDLKLKNVNPTLKLAGKEKKAGK